MTPRSQCVVCGECVYEWFLRTGFPIFNGCSDAPSDQDEIFDFRVGRCSGLRYAIEQYR